MKSLLNSLSRILAPLSWTLAPLSWVYAAIMDIRNWMFTNGWLREREFEVETICVGNLAVGGTGKTPHCEWLVQQLLADGRRVAILSRGYGRSTRGYLEANPEATASEVGDEPLQMFHRFEPRVIVAVCEDRCQGLEQLQLHHPDVDVVVLDDAFQHRYVKPHHRVLLSDYSRPYYKDHVLPWGRLREKQIGARRAEVIIVSKCPTHITEAERESITRQIKPSGHQRVFFTTMTYEPLPELTQSDTCSIVLLSGIAHPEPFFEHFCSKHVHATLRFPDHHNFTPHDLARIEHVAAEADYLVTTDKDFARLHCLPLSEATRRKILVQHICINVIGNSETELLRSICTKSSNNNLP